MGKAVRARRLVYLVHRWSGILGCLLMAGWLFSGAVMLFVGYPKLLPQERLARLPVLDAGCCVPVEQALAASRAPSRLRQLTLTSIAGRPAYRLAEGDGGLLVVDARTGRPAPAVDTPQALAAAAAFLPGVPGEVQGQVADDRWTHSGAFDAHRPLFKVQMHDAASTLLYVSSATGEVVLEAPAAQRAWNLAGAWLHWLYMFRDGARDPLWSWLVIGLSALCTLSALTGALAGIWRWRFAGRYKSGARTPYRGMQRWHHLAGLAFGLVLVTWIFSGLMSMNPLGIFDAGERPDQAAYRGGTPGAVRPRIGTGAALAMLHAQGLAPRELDWRVLAGRPHLLVRGAPGQTRLVIEEAGRWSVAARWPHATLAAAGARLLHAPLVCAEPAADYDAYYYARRETSMYAAEDRGLPVLRLQFADAGRTVAYLDPRSGDVALSLDRAQRTGRWLFNLLHSWDLPVLMRQGGLRVGAMAALSLGAGLIAATGTAIGLRRLLRVAGRGRAGDAIVPRPAAGVRWRRGRRPRPMRQPGGCR